MNEAEKVKRAQALVELREDLPRLLEFMALSATMTRAKFKALVKEGFTEAQAIELCKSA